MISYSDSVRYLYALGNETGRIKLGLERMRAILDALGQPERACRFVHVAGTNGKGSTCAMIHSGLREAGVRTGLFISPHLVEPTERIQINGQPVTEAQFAEAFDRVHRVAVASTDTGAMDAHPTYFETVTAMGLLLFRDLNAETVVLEVGLGGRLDATNVVTPELCVITPVDYDHEKYLGSSLESIAGEKAGILKPGVPVVVGRQRREAEAVILRRAAELGIQVTSTKQWRVEELEQHPRGSRFLAHGPVRVRVECPLAGEHQVENALTAVAALLAAGVSVEAIEAGIRATRWPGRLEHVRSAPEVILDGAHNPSGARALAAYLRRHYADRRIWLVFGAMRDKAAEEMASVLSPLANRVILTSAGSSRALRPEALRPFFDNPAVTLTPNSEAALELSLDAPPGDVVVIAGSLILVGEARRLLLKPASAPPGSA